MSAGGAGDEGGHDVGGVTVERLAGPVVAHGRARVGVRGGLLDVSQRHTGVQGGGVQEWRRLCGEIRLVIPARRAHPFHGAVGGVAVHPSPGGAQEDRPGGPVADVKIEGSSGAGRQWMVACLPPLRVTRSVR
jgi:hypothetical protein